MRLTSTDVYTGGWLAIGSHLKRHWSTQELYTNTAAINPACHYPGLSIEPLAEPEPQLLTQLSNDRVLT
jgi:hypothetical protein